MRPFLTTGGATSCITASCRRYQRSERGIEGAPTLAVEVLSPSTAHLDRGRKMKLYAEHGEPYYWIVDPESRSIEAYTLTGAAYALAGRVTSELAALPPFSDLTVDPAALWS